MRIGKLGVVGAGTMGAGIAALAASAGVPVVLLDIPASEGKDRNAVARGGLDRAKKARPAAFMDAQRAALIEIGNTEDDLAKLAGCDLIIEAIIEQPAPKRALYEKLEKYTENGAIVATNTSGIPMSVLTEGRSDAFRDRFLGLHFFNPPRYLHLLEIIPTSHTTPETLASARAFCERSLGKGIVLAKDVPGFVANRLGVYGMVLALRMMEQYDFDIDTVDVLTGPMLARANSATFRTGDLTGIDVLGHVIGGLGKATGEDFALPEWVQKLVSSGRIGEKSGAGFYKKVGKEITTLDWKTLEYGPRKKVDDATIAKMPKMSLDKRFAAVRDLPGKLGDFAREYLLRFSHYVLERTPEIAYDIVGVDRALEWGYAWEAGPYKQMDLLGLDWVRDGFRKLGLSEPKLLQEAKGSFYKETGAEVDALSLGGGYAKVPEIPGSISLAALHREKKVIEENAGAALIDLGDGVAALEFRTKMNSLGEPVIRMLERAIELGRKGAFEGLVIGNDDPRTFTAGADLMMIAQLVQGGDWKQMDQAVKTFQDCSMAIRQSPFPVVAAPFGLTLGGGCEWSLHADAVQAHAELYMGLVEVGVGLIPGGGGTKELLFRFTQELAPYDEADPFEGVKRAFGLIAMAKTSTSALEAQNFGFLRDRDRISMNRDRQLTDAKRRVLALAPDYVAPPLRTITALGAEAIGNLRYGVWAMHEAGQVSDFEVTLANHLAYILCGGDGPPRVVTEQDVLDLEREAFLTLLGTKQTQERIRYMLETGKPLRN